MDIRQLRYFVKVIELKSLSRAAEALHIAQPALGMQIRKLEHELRSQLLVRHSRGVEPTAAGNLLCEHAREILGKVEVAKEAVRDLSASRDKQVRLAISPSTLPEIPVRLVQRSALELPNTQIVVQEAVNATIVDWVRSEHVHLGLVHLSDPNPNDLLVDPLVHEHAVFVQAPSKRHHPASISLAEACQYPLVMPSRPHILREHLQVTAQREGLEPAVIYEIDSIPTILEMVERNIAGAILPPSAIARHALDGKVIARTIVGPELRLTLSLVRSPRRVLSKAENLLRAMLMDIAREHAFRANAGIDKHDKAALPNSRDLEPRSAPAVSRPRSRPRATAAVGTGSAAVTARSPM